MSSTYVHPTAIVEGAKIGANTSVWAHVHIMPKAKVGRNCNIGDGVYIESGAEIGDGVTVKNQAMIWEGVTIQDYAFIGPGVVFTNDLYPRSPRFPEMKECYNGKEWLCKTLVEEGVSIGANATILCGIRIGEYASIAAGSVVTKDVEPYVLMAGNPARNIGFVNKKGKRI